MHSQTQPRLNTGNVPVSLNTQQSTWYNKWVETHSIAKVLQTILKGKHGNISAVIEKLQNRDKAADKVVGKQIHEY